MDQQTRDEVRNVLTGMLDRIIRKRTITEPVTVESIQLNNPFGYLLVPFEIWKASKFERSFVTSLGQTCFEQIARIIAEGTGAVAERQHTEDITLNSWQMDEIENIIRSQRASQTIPSWEAETNAIANLNTPRIETISVRFDLYVRRQNGQEEYYSMKTVKPNLDQTAEAKRAMLQMKAAKAQCTPFFALPFNPAGNDPYRTVHTIPYQLLNMDDINCVLIGQNFWNAIGADENTYSELMDIFAEVGAIYSPRIREEFLES